MLRNTLSDPLLSRTAFGVLLFDHMIENKDAEIYNILLNPIWNCKNCIKLETTLILFDKLNIYLKLGANPKNVLKLFQLHKDDNLPLGFFIKENLNASG